MMIYGSVCSGIEAATVAWHDLGLRPSFFSEIDRFPRAVLMHHYPDVPLRGDFTEIQGADHEPIDLLVGGTPCQSFSVAGKRLGLDDPRGNLALEYLALAGRLRPQWLVWENVPGLLSSDGGRDFGIFLGTLGELGYGFAYRILDAQYFGVPQRRRRVFVVGYLGDWRPAAAVLLEREGLSWDLKKGEKARESAPTIPARSTAGGGLGTDFDCDGGLIPDVAGQLGGGASGTRGWAYGGNRTSGPIDVATALSAHSGPHGRLSFENETFLTTPAVASHARQDPDVSGDVTHPLGFKGTGHAVGFQPVADTLFAAYGTKWNGNASADNGSLFASQGMAVRRLTPRECERLQGFPDDYTLVPYRNKPAEDCPDGPRYKALGNSMAVPVMRWIGERIKMFESLTEENFKAEVTGDD